MVGHAEEKTAVQRERQRAEAEHANRNLAAAVVSESSENTAVKVSPGHRSQGCCTCGQPGHLASPALLVPKSGGGHQMVFGCRKVNLKICFSSNLRPNIEHAFQQFSWAYVFSVLDPNSAYFQNPFAPRGAAGDRLLHPLWAVTI
jgi:hypothetical protein